MSADTLILAFTLGFLIGYMLQPWRLRGWWWSIRRYIPRRCPECGGRCKRDSMRHVEHRAAGWIYICQDCYNKHYRPLKKFEVKHDEYRD
jgi:hypothetical protein